MFRFSCSDEDRSIRFLLILTFENLHIRATIFVYIRTGFAYRDWFAIARQKVYHRSIHDTFDGFHWFAELEIDIYISQIILDNLGKISIRWLSISWQIPKLSDLFCNALNYFLRSFLDKKDKTEELHVSFVSYTMRNSCWDHQNVIGHMHT